MASSNLARAKVLHGLGPFIALLKWVIIHSMQENPQHCYLGCIVERDILDVFLTTQLLGLDAVTSLKPDVHHASAVGGI